MALEDLTGAKYIDALDSANPVGATDFVSTADDHLRGVKNVLKMSFPNIDGPMTADPGDLNKLDGMATSQAELNFLVGVTSLIQTQLNALETLKATLASPNFTGNVDFAGTTTHEDELILNAGYSEDADQYTATTGTRGLDTAAATYFYPSADLGTAVITFTFDNPAASGRVTSFTMELLGADDATLTWPAGVVWDLGGVEPEWTDGKDLVSFVTRDAGTTWYGFLGGLDFS